MSRARLNPRRKRRIRRGGGCALLCILGSWFSIHTVSAASAAPSIISPTRRPGVTAANVRVTTGYAFSRVDSTSAGPIAVNPGTTSTLRIEDTDAHTVRVEMVGTVPVTHSIGLRGKLRGSVGGMRQNVDLLEPGNDDFDATSFGAMAEAFLRDPDLGSLTLGGSFDRLDGNRGSDANEFGGSVAVAIFFPDMGLAPLDWFIGFDYAYRDVSNSREADFYTVRGGIGLYATDNLQLRFGGVWSRAENGIVSEEDSEGFMDLRWRLPLPMSVELSMQGSIGVSEYKESPFPADDRMIYGASVGLTFRFRSAPTLLESVRAYD